MYTDPMLIEQALLLSMSGAGDQRDRAYSDDISLVGHRDECGGALGFLGNLLYDDPCSWLCMAAGPWTGMGQVSYRTLMEGEMSWASLMLETPSAVQCRTGSECQLGHGLVWVPISDPVVEDLAGQISAFGPGTKDMGVGEMTD